MTTRVILVRHGETVWNKEGRYQGQIDTDLSEKGRQQADNVANALKDFPIDVAFSSPLRRSYDTAVAIASKHGLQVQQVEGLTEIAHGTWEGLLSHEVSENYKEMVEQWQKEPHLVHMPEGENLTQVQERAMLALDSIVKGNLGKNILVVAHDATNKAIICAMLGIDLANFWQIKQDNTAISIFEYSDGKWRVCLLNDTCHFGQIFSGIEQAAL